MVHMRNLLEEMVKEEESLKKRLLTNVQKYNEDLLRLTRELQLPTYEVPTSFMFSAARKIPKKNKNHYLLLNMHLYIQH